MLKHILGFSFAVIGQVEVRQCEKFAAKGATAGSVGITRGEISVSGHQVG